MSKVTVRPANQFDIPFLQKELRKTDWEQVDLKRSLVWVAECDEIPFEFIALRLVYQIEPLFVFNKTVPLSAQKKGAYLLYKEAEKYLSDPVRNKSGIHWAFLHTLSGYVSVWMKKLNWQACYRQKGGKLWVKGFSKQVL